jgi:diguanylate cyclase (GGDEF)-like protein
MNPALPFSLAYIALFAAAPLLVPAHSMSVSYAFLIGAPFCAMVVALKRCVTTGFRPRQGWSIVAVAFLIWGLGMAASARQDLLLGNTEVAPADSMLFYVLYAVPLTWAMASSWRRERAVVSIIDGALASVLGVLFFVHTRATTNDPSLSPQEQGRWLVWMFDVMNAFLLAGAIGRWWGAETPPERRFFTVLMSFEGIYLLAAAFNNHWTALHLNLDVGSALDIVPSLPFLAFAVLAWPEAPSKPERAPSPRPRVWFVTGASPLLMSAALLTVSLVLVRSQYLVGVAGILAAVIGFGLRTVLREVHHIAKQSKLRDDRSALRVLVSTDPLTSVANRRAFDDAFVREWRRGIRTGQALGLLMIDVDHFKKLNDRYGHAVGDACLKRVATAMQAQVQRSTDLVARYGGEEFVVLMPETNIDCCLTVAQAVRACVEALWIPNADAEAQFVTVSIGVACLVPGVDDEEASLLHAADWAVYEAKRMGRNRVFTWTDDCRA